MRFQFFWDEPYLTLLAFLYQFSTTLFALTFGLALAIPARLRIGRVRLSEPPADLSIDAAGFASEILTAGGALGQTVVRATGPLADFYDPARREVRLSEAVAGARSPEALAIAAHQAGHALQQARFGRISQGPVLVILGAKLASGVAWMTLVVGAMMLSPFLTDRAALLYAATVFALLLLQIAEADANRRASTVIRQSGLDATWTTPEKEAFCKALAAARWVEIASTVPRLRTPWRRPGLFF